MGKVCSSYYEGRCPVTNFSDFTLSDDTASFVGSGKKSLHDWLCHGGGTADAWNIGFVSEPMCFWVWRSVLVARPRFRHTRVQLGTGAQRIRA